MSTPTEPDPEEYPTAESIANAGDIGDYVVEIYDPEYVEALARIAELMDIDPEPTAQEGIELRDLVQIVEKYEAWTQRSVNHRVNQTQQSIPWSMIF